MYFVVKLKTVVVVQIRLFITLTFPFVYLFVLYGLNFSGEKNLV
jgi:hypothetical protein